MCYTSKDKTPTPSPPLPWLVHIGVQTVPLSIVFVGLIVAGIFYYKRRVSKNEFPYEQEMDRGPFLMASY